MAQFFISRPIFAWVLAIVVMLAGALAVRALPLEQYPDIAPVAVAVSANYPGASAQTVEDSVTQVIEQRLQGLDGLVAMQSTSSSAGQARIALTFVAGTNADVAQMQVQNKVQQALRALPQTVQDNGVVVTKTGTDFLMIVTFSSDDPTMTRTDIGDFITSSVADVIARVQGVGEVQVFGSGYAMRIWLDPAMLARYALNPSDLAAAIVAQNTQVAAGALGALPAVDRQMLTATVTARSKLQTVEQFKDVIVRTDPATGALVRLGDVARVELGADGYNVSQRFNGRPASGMGIRLASGANALAVADAVKKRLGEMEASLPVGMRWAVGYDTTPFVKVSVEQVVRTLVEAIALVVVVMLLFMQNLRATLIPTLAVPVVLLGTFAVLAAAGYSINTLTLFAMVLAIGLLVDDAIVVVENVERLMRDEHLGARAATRKSMREITGALVGIGLVLAAVFVPMAFFGGSTGVIYRQFSITLVTAVLLSVGVAMTLSPALTASILKPHAAHGAPDEGQAARRGPLARFFGAFNHGFDRLAGAYAAFVRGSLSRSGAMLAVYALLLAALAFGFRQLPTAFLPDEDQGLLQVQVQLPKGATDVRTDAAMREVEAYLVAQPEVRAVTAVRGNAGDQGSGSMWVLLNDWSVRTAPHQHAAELAARFSKELAPRVRDARVFALLPPAIRGLGANAGWSVQLQDLGGLGHDALVAARDRFLALAGQDARLQSARASGLPDAPEVVVRIDDAKAASLGLSTSDVNATLATALGGTYVNDFIDRGRVKRVRMQGDAPYRMQPSDVLRWQVRNRAGQMVPFAAFASVDWGSGAARLERYNGLASFELIGGMAPGVSSGAAMAAVEAAIAQLPQGIAYEWSGQSYQERLSGAQAPALYAVSLLFVFLCLAALYESWTVPFSVLLVVPLGVIGAVAATWGASLKNDVYFQIGLLATIGLSAKNAILIVEYAKLLEAQGMALVEATVRAARIRLRPILMTSLAFMFGVLPLAIASGPGSASRRAIGTGVLGGMAAATVLGVLFVPVFYVVVRRLTNRLKRRPPDAPPPTADEGPDAADASPRGAVA